jgi:hypothetical protein
MCIQGMLHFGKRGGGREGQRERVFVGAVLSSLLINGCVYSNVCV